MYLLKENDVVIEVVRRNENKRGWNYADRYYFLIDNSKNNLKTNDIVLIDTSYNGRKMSSDITDSFGLHFCKVTLVITDKTEMYDYINNHSIYTPFILTSVNLDSYFAEIKKIDRKKEIENTLRKATSKIEEISKFKMLAELNPAYKDLYEEYLKTCSEETQNLLPNTDKNN